MWTELDACLFPRPVWITWATDGEEIFQVKYEGYPDPANHAGELLRYPPHKDTPNSHQLKMGVSHLWEGFGKPTELPEPLPELSLPASDFEFQRHIQETKKRIAQTKAERARQRIEHPDWFEDGAFLDVEQDPSLDDQTRYLMKTLEEGIKRTGSNVIPFHHGP